MTNIKETIFCASCISTYFAKETNKPKKPISYRRKCDDKIPTVSSRRVTSWILNCLRSLQNLPLSIRTGSSIVEEAQGVEARPHGPDPDLGSRRRLEEPRIPFGDWNYRCVLWEAAQTSVPLRPGWVSLTQEDWAWYLSSFSRCIHTASYRNSEIKKNAKCEFLTRHQGLPVV